VFAAGLGAAGIGPDAVVVAYDDTGGMSAGRLVWLLRVLGQPAALLDGGLAAWPGPWAVGPDAPVAVTHQPRPWPEDAFVGLGEVEGAARRGVLIDARAGERFRGEVEPVDARPGHVPGARNVPWASLLRPDGRFADPATLRERFAAAGVDLAGPVVAMCGSGVSACVDLLAAERAGLGPGRLYPGSWSQWCADPARPAATGP
jgi:thiosulfate/3-mercaptopyruvate sulfurtransferase